MSNQSLDANQLSSCSTCVRQLPIKPLKQQEKSSISLLLKTSDLCDQHGWLLACFPFWCRSRQQLHVRKLALIGFLVWQIQQTAIATVFRRPSPHSRLDLQLCKMASICTICTAMTKRAIIALVCLQAQFMEVFQHGAALLNSQNNTYLPIDISKKWQPNSNKIQTYLQGACPYVQKL